MAQLLPSSVRPLGPADEAAIQHILDTSEFVSARFEYADLLHLLARYPAAGVFSAAQSVPPARATSGRHATEASLQAFMLVNWLVAPSAWIGGFGVTWSRGEAYESYLNPLLEQLGADARAHGARTLYYTGSDLENDWLCGAMERRGFTLASVLRSYDKLDYAIPDEGNQMVRVRPFQPDDVDGVVAIENLSFDQLWRHDAASFLDVAAEYPYFVVAEDDAGIVGYQFSTVDATTGYLVRIAVHPRATGHGVGTRLMAEAIRYFQRHHVWKIVLNSEETNHRAHTLYERFGFILVEPHGFVLARDV